MTNGCSEEGHTLYAGPCIWIEMERVNDRYGLFCLLVSFSMFFVCFTYEKTLKREFLN